MATALVIDKDMADDLISVLDECKKALKETKTQLDAQKQADENKLLSIKQAREYLGGVSEDTLIYYRRYGLPYYKKAKDGVWYRKGDIDAWLDSGRIARHTSR